MPKRKRPVKVTELILGGLCHLIEQGEKPYSELTIQDIVDEAGVCRNSFYRNYTTKDDIFQKKLWELSTTDDSDRLSRTADHFTFYDIFEGVAALMQINKRKCLILLILANAQAAAFQVFSRYGSNKDGVSRP